MSTSIRYYCLSIILFIVQFAYGQDYNAMHQNAIKQYKLKNYTEVIHIYESVLESGVESADIYYNLGNAYYKDNQIGEAILNYERALLINPSFDEAKVNLQIAETKVTDKINATNSAFTDAWFNSFASIMSANSWAILTVVLFVLSLFLFLLYVLLKNRFVRKSSFFTSLILLIACVCSFYLSYFQTSKIIERNKAIVLAPTSEIKSVPDKSGTVLFVLHEGSKVLIMSSLEEWVEIQIADGNVGWVKQTDIESI